MVSDNLVLDNFWTNSGFTCPISVHAASHWTGAVQTLYLYGQRVDRACTFQFIGQTFDRLLTEFGQRLDFTSNLCPTNQWVLVPIFDNPYFLIMRNYDN